jgi:hypothetical protein
MISADWITIGAILIFAAIGLIFGFGQTFRLFASGIFGFIISIIVCYFLYGIVINWTFTQDLMNKIVEALQNADNTFCNFLITIRIDIIVLCLAMFIIVQVLRVIFVTIVKGVAEINNVVIIVLNRLLGVAFMVALVAMATLIVFQIITWVGGTTASDFAQKLDGSVLKLDEIFANNPLIPMIDLIKNGSN